MSWKLMMLGLQIETYTNIFFILIYSINEKAAMLSNYEVKLAWVKLRRFLEILLYIQAVHNFCVIRTQGEFSVGYAEDLWCGLKI